MPVGATIGAGALGAGASIYGANAAASAQRHAADQALEFQKQAYDQNQANFKPFIDSGTGATNLLSSFYGLNGTDPALGQSALDAFAKSPDYVFAKQQSQSALENSAAAKGGLLGGNQLRAAQEYGSGLATQNLGNYLTRISGIAGQGVSAASSAAGNSTTGANTIGNTMMAGGTADASGILGTVKGINSGLNSLSLYSQLNKSSYAPTTPTGAIGSNGWQNPDFNWTSSGGGYGTGGVW